MVASVHITFGCPGMNCDGMKTVEEVALRISQPRWSYDENFFYDFPIDSHVKISKFWQITKKQQPIFTHHQHTYNNVLEDGQNIYNFIFPYDCINYKKIYFGRSPKVIAYIQS